MCRHGFARLQGYGNVWSYGEAAIDRISPARRSRNMASIRAKDTAPELIVRRLLHRAGYRFRAHASFLPGTPDVAFTRRKKVVFVHGCFWHRHPGCRRTATPTTRVEFWANKFERNCERDRRVQAQLHDIGWDALVIWECETKLTDSLRARLELFLGTPRATTEPTSC